MNDRRIKRSKRLYASLINLYPKKYAAEYGPAMVQVFTDQCRDASRDSRFFGLPGLWVRTLIDLCKTAIREHLAASREGGVGAAFPGAPLPWKELALILLPGLVTLMLYMLFSLGAGKLAGVIFDGALYLSVALVILAWWRAKKFPAWGLIPAGLFVVQIIKLLTALLIRLHLSTGIITVLFVLAIPCFFHLYTRHHSISRASWFCFVFFAFLWIGQFAMALYIGHNLQMFFDNRSNLEVTMSSLMWGATSKCAVLLFFILLGTLFARRHGSLAVLLPASWLFFTTGIVDFTQGSFNVSFLFPVACCLCIAVLFPAWIARSALVTQQTRAVTALILFISIGTMTMQLIMTWPMQFVASSSSLFMYAYFLEWCLAMGSGLLLAMSLYRSASSGAEDAGEAGAPEKALA
jgi:hypothetical protein